VKKGLIVAGALLYLWVAGVHYAQTVRARKAARRGAA
jgi:hypothetical protein